MTLATAAILLVCGGIMGWINNVAGAAGVVGLAGLEHAALLDAKAANASLRLSGVMIGLCGWLGFQSRGHRLPRRAWAFGLWAVPGAVAGSALALTLPIWVYRFALFAILLAVLAQQLRQRTPTSAPSAALQSMGPWLFGLVGLHMGFVQVGTGLVAMLALTTVHSRDLVEINAAKTIVVICAATASTLVFATSEDVEWGSAAVLAAGCALGSFLASRWTVAKGHGAVRVVVLVITSAALIELSVKLLRGT